MLKISVLSFLLTFSYVFSENRTDNQLKTSASQKSIEKHVKIVEDKFDFINRHISIRECEGTFHVVDLQILVDCLHKSSNAHLIALLTN